MLLGSNNFCGFTWLDNLISPSWISKKFLISIFFPLHRLMKTEDRITNACSVTGSRYAAMLKNYVLPELSRPNALNDIVWMQDGAPPHIVRSIKRLLDQHFGDRIISRLFRGLRDPQIWRLWISGFGDISNPEFTCAIRKHCRTYRILYGVRLEMSLVPCCVQRYCPPSPACNA